MLRRIVIATVSAILLTACGSGSSEHTTTPSADEVPVRFDDTVKLADGRELLATCVGKGTPTILLEAGGSGDGTDWPPLFVDTLGKVTTTCLYTRAGGPGSDEPAKRPVSMADVTGDAFGMLDAVQEKADVKGPYVLVGWSLGGAVALAEALTKPDEAVGLAILDTDFPADFLKVCAQQGRPAKQCRADYEGDIDAKFMETEIAAAVHPLDVPAVLVTAMSYPECDDSAGRKQEAEVEGVIVTARSCAGLATAIADKQVADWRAALPRVEQTRVEATHDGLPSAEGERVAALIESIVREARGQS